MSSSERQRCETLTVSLNAPLSDKWRSAYDNDSFHYVTKGAESEQPVGALCYQWVGCRDHAGLVCLFSSFRELAGSGSTSLCWEQRKRVFYDMGPLILIEVILNLCNLWSQQFCHLVPIRTQRWWNSADDILSGITFEIARIFSNQEMFIE